MRMYIHTCLHAHPYEGVHARRRKQTNTQVPFGHFAARLAMLLQQVGRPHPSEHPCEYSEYPCEYSEYPCEYSEYPCEYSEYPM